MLAEARSLEKVCRPQSRFPLTLTIPSGVRRERAYSSAASCFGQSSSTSSSSPE